MEVEAAVAVGMEEEEEVARTEEEGEEVVSVAHQEDTAVEAAALAGNLIVCPTWGLVLAELIGIWLHSPSLKRTFIGNIQT
jgi:hypothetical protein